MDEHPAIHFREGESGRRPAVLGTGLDVAQIIETLGENAGSIEETADYLDLSTAEVEAAVRHYVDYKDEIAMPGSTRAGRSQSANTTYGAAYKSRAG